MSTNVDEYREEIPNGAVEMYDFLIDKNCPAYIAAATSTYVFARYINQAKSQTVVADYFETTPASIRKWRDTLLENRGDWSVGDDQDVGLVDQLPRTRRHPSSPASKEELVNRIREESGLGARDPYSSENLSGPEIEDLTGQADPLMKKRVLEDEFGLVFGKGEDATMHIQLNKSGVQKILNGFTEND